MSEREALLAAIKANPDDDTVRLVFADWLDEHGGERDRDWASFIRVSVRRSNGLSFVHTPANGTSYVWGSNRTRNRRALLSGLLRVLRPDEHLGRFQRGFLHTLYCTPRKWFECADALLAVHPLRVVNLYSVPMPHQLRSIAAPDAEGGFDVLPVLESKWPGIVFAVL
jgi:uncharacterized protein (TIGR02996 family)